ncbi:MAG: G8 domain-containing protein [Candidatus Caldarchaeales archaeon]|nr:G8 domain-containing protein [Candidatus Caldarchaeales archaeon]
MATLTSVKSGYWSDPTVWNAGRVPAAGDQVVIASGHTVTYNVVEGSANDVELGTAGNSLDVDIQGTLQFDTTATQPLRLRFKGYMLVRSTGKLIVGTPSNPMPVRVTIVKTTSGYHMILHDDNAEVSFVGSPNVPYDSQQGWYRFITTLASSAASGATQIIVSENLNWQVGDYVMLPRLPGAELPTSVISPFLAQVTAVSGNTLTLGTSLPQAYPAGAWVAKVNRPILLYFTNNNSGYYFFGGAAAGNYLNFTGLRWLWFQVSGTTPAYLAYYARFYDSNISYNTLLPHYLSTSSVASAQVYYPTIYYHCGVPFQSINAPVKHVGGVLTSSHYVLGSRYNISIENAHVWDWYPQGNLSNKVSMKNCTIFVFCSRMSLYHIVEDSTIYGLNYYQNFTVPYLSRNVFRNCKFYNYSSLGYSTTYRNRFDWGYIGGLILADYLNCELYDTWVEPYTFSDAIGYDIPKVRFVNKKVGSTVIKEQEFQAGGIITTTDGLLPPDVPLKATYSYRFEPKNPNLPLVYRFPLNENDNLLEVWSYADTSQYSIPAGCRVEIVPQSYGLQPDPWGSDIPRLAFAPIPAANLQWQKVAVFAPYTWEKAVGQILVRGSSGAIWLVWRSRRVSLSLFSPYLFVDASTKSVYTNIADMTIYLSALPLSQPTKVLAQFLNVGQAINSAVLRIRQFGSTSVTASVQGLPSGSVWAFDLPDSIVNQLASQTYYAAEFVLTLADNSTVVLPRPAMVVFRG